MSKEKLLVTRREFIRAAIGSSLLVANTLSAAGTGEAPVGSDLSAASTGESPVKTVDVAIIGAGLAGLTAAWELRKAGVSVCVVEARDRVGGRTLDYSIGGGQVVESGGQWVGSTQTEVLALAGQLGIETFASYTPGKTVLYMGGARFLVDAGNNDSPSVQEAKYQLDQMAVTVPLNAPWTAAKAQEWDAITIAAWLETNVLDVEARVTIDQDIQAFLSAPANRISLLYFLFYVHSAGGLRALTTDAQEFRFKGGTQAISKKLAQLLGEDLVLDSPVNKIVQADGKVEVHAQRVCIIARRAVLAMMPSDVRRISFEPRLPKRRSALNQQWRGAAGFKINVIYPQPFWRDQGLSGMSVSDKGATELTFDNSPADTSKGVLMAFISKERVPVDAAARRRAVLESLAVLFGQAALAPTDYVEMDWSKDRWTAGCVSPLPPNVLTKYGAAIRQPHKLVHWAGTETAEVWNGYMDGAVRSGKRVAIEIINAL